MVKSIDKHIRIQTPELIFQAPYVYRTEVENGKQQAQKLKETFDGKKHWVLPKEFKYKIIPQTQDLSRHGETTQLQGYQIKKLLSDSKDSKTQHIFKLMGNSEFAELFAHQSASFLRKLDQGNPRIPVVYNIYNPRGVGGSKGRIRSSNDLAVDHFLLIKKYIDETLGGKEQAHRLTIDAQSLGAAYGTMTVAMLQATK